MANIGQCNLKEGYLKKCAKMGLLSWLWGHRGREESLKVHFDEQVTNITTREKTNSLVVAREKPRFWLTRLWLRFLRLRRKDERQRGDSSPDQGFHESKFTPSPTIIGIRKQTCDKLSFSGEFINER